VDRIRNPTSKSDETVRSSGCRSVKSRRSGLLFKNQDVFKEDYFCWKPLLGTWGYILLILSKFHFYIDKRA